MGNKDGTKDSERLSRQCVSGTANYELTKSKILTNE
jgi:hypothetical protein